MLSARTASRVPRLLIFKCLRNDEFATEPFHLTLGTQNRKQRNVFSGRNAENPKAGPARERQQ